MSMSKKDFIKYEHEIRWIENELATKKLSPAQRGEYRHQIRKKELEIAFNSGHREPVRRRVVRGELAGNSGEHVGGISGGSGGIVVDYEEAKAILLKREYRTIDLVNLRAQMLHAHRILDKLTAPPLHSCVETAGSTAGICNKGELTNERN